MFLPRILVVPLAIVLFICTLTLVIWRPGDLDIGLSALGGAVVALLSGLVQVQQIPEVWAIVGNPTLTLVGLILLSLVLDEAGWFRWLALHLARWGNGWGHWLFILLMLLGTGMTAFFTNDGTALILTPIVLQMVTALKFSPQATFAFVMATGFIADTTSLPFTVSNLVNILSADYFSISFVRYALVMVPVSLVAAIASLVVLYIFFGRQIPRTYRLTEVAPPGTAIRDPLVCRWGLPLLLSLLIGYLVAVPLHLPVSLIVGLVTLGTLALAGRWFQPGVPPVIALQPLLKAAPWQVIGFSLGLYLVVFGLRNAGLTEILSQGLLELTHWGLTLTIMGTGFLAAIFSSGMNNLPAVLFNALSIQSATETAPAFKEAMVYANIIGCDLGPKLTPIGSLATLLWLHRLSREGIYISWGQYFRIGIVLTLPVLFVTLLSLSIWLPWLIA